MFLCCLFFTLAASPVSSSQPSRFKTQAKADVNAALRVITSSIQGLKQWAYYCKEKVPVIFEIFGNLMCNVLSLLDIISHWLPLYSTKTSLK